MGSVVGVLSLEERNFSLAVQLGYTGGWFVTLIEIVPHQLGITIGGYGLVVTHAVFAQMCPGSIPRHITPFSPA